MRGQLQGQMWEVQRKVVRRTQAQIWLGKMRDL